MDARILLVDDEEAFARSVSDTLKDFGFTVEHTATWEEGEQLFRMGMHDLVIADFDLAGVRDGLLLLARLKSLRPNARLVLISGKSVTVAPETVQSSRVVDRFLIKDGNLMPKLLDEAKASVERAGQPSDWIQLARCHLVASEIDQEQMNEIDTLMSNALWNVDQ